MKNKNFVIVSNQRTGSTWFITSLGNCKNVKTDFEVKWSKELLIGKPSPYHFFLKNNKFKNIFDKLNSIEDNTIYGTKFVFDFYKLFPFEDYINFFSKFDDCKIIHLERDYIDILKSKLVGRVTHILNKENLEKNRLIDRTILEKQKHYLSIQKNSIKNNKEIPFAVSTSYLYNLFINDVLALSLQKKNNFININYLEIKNNLKEISNFLRLQENDLEKNFFRFPVLKKNKIIFEEKFEKITELHKINDSLKNKLSFLKKKEFNINDIFKIDPKTKEMKILI